MVTSPPYWTLKTYPRTDAQLGAMDDYEEFLRSLDRVWRECERVLVPGGRICCVVGDVCIPRKKEGKHYVVPVHADIQVGARRLGLDCLTPVIWHKISNGRHESAGNGAGYYGKPYQPGGIIKSDIEYILFLRKGAGYRSPSPTQRALSKLTKAQMQSWFQSIWSDIPGASTRDGHPAPYPVELAERLIRMFSFAGDTVLEPFAGSGSTLVAAHQSGRNSIGVEIEPSFVELGNARLEQALNQQQVRVNTTATLTVHRVPTAVGACPVPPGLDQRGRGEIRAVDEGIRGTLAAQDAEWRAALKLRRAPARRDRPGEHSSATAKPALEPTS